MSQVKNTQPLPIQKLKSQKVFQLENPVFCIGTLTFVLITILVLMATSTIRSLIGTNLTSSPEYSTDQSFVEKRYTQAHVENFSANPKLMITQCYSGKASATIERSPLSINPELKVCYQCVEYKINDSDFLATNPEIKVHRHFVNSVGR